MSDLLNKKLSLVAVVLLVGERQKIGSGRRDRFKSQLDW